jgi:hypothetical protein
MSVVMILVVWCAVLSRPVMVMVVVMLPVVSVAVSVFPRLVRVAGIGELILR